MTVFVVWETVKALAWIFNWLEDLIGMIDGLSINLKGLSIFYKVISKYIYGNQ